MFPPWIPASLVLWLLVAWINVDDCGSRSSNVEDKKLGLKDASIDLSSNYCNIFLTGVKSSLGESNDVSSIFIASSGDGSKLLTAVVGSNDC